MTFEYSADQNLFGGIGGLVERRSRLFRRSQRSGFGADRQPDGVARARQLAGESKIQ